MKILNKRVLRVMTFQLFPKMQPQPQPQEHTSLLKSNKHFNIITYPVTNVFRFESNNISLRRVKFYTPEIEKRSLYLDYDLNLLSEEIVPTWDDREHISLKFFPSDSRVITAKLGYSRYPNQDTLGQCHDLSGIPELSLHRMEELRYVADCGEFEISLFGSIVYVVSDEVGNVIDWLVEPTYGLQEGDCGVVIWVVNHKHIIVWNDGDVMSVITMQRK